MTFKKPSSLFGINKEPTAMGFFDMIPFVAERGMLENAWGQISGITALHERVTPCHSKNSASIKNR